MYRCSNDDNFWFSAIIFDSRAASDLESDCFADDENSNQNFFEQ